MREPETVEDFMRKVSVLKGCGEQSASCTSNPEKCECWRSASTGARLLRSALDKPEGRDARNKMVIIVDMAVDCWHAVAKEHGLKPCNCFRELFVASLIKAGLFDGYTNEDVR